MTNVLSPYIRQQFFANNGQPLAGGLVYTYGAGSSTPVATYTASGSTNTNPIVLDSRGSCDIWLVPNTGYKIAVTDSTGNAIPGYPVDNIINAQLLSLFGGVDTGSSNTYLINFAANFSSYVNGTVIYWIPSNNNSGASTINVSNNGNVVSPNYLGVIPIVNPNGTALGANQIVAGQMTEIVYYSATPNPAGGTQAAFQLTALSSFTGSTIGTFGPETPMVAASTTDLGSAGAHVVLITGTTTITSFGTSASLSAPIYHVRFGSSLTLTYSSNLILPGAGNVVTSAGDACLAEYLGSGVWKVTIYQSFTGIGTGAKIKPADTTQTSNATITIDPDLISASLAVGRYAFKTFLIFDSVTSTAGFKWVNVGTAVDSRANTPALGMGVINGNVTNAIISPYNVTISYTTVATTADSNVIDVDGSLLVATAGTFGIGWAQASSTAAATTLRAGSYLTTTLLNTGSSNSTVQRIYNTAASGTETFPSGYTTLTIEAWGPSGNGGTSYYGGTHGIAGGGGGGGSGSYSRTTLAVTGLGGNTLAYTVGAVGGNTTVSAGSQALTTMTAPSGANGATATSTSGGAGGAGGGAATGGTVANLAGNSGSAGNSGNAGSGGGALSGIFAGGSPGGHGGYSSSGVLAGQSGSPGVVSFTYQ